MKLKKDPEGCQDAAISRAVLGKQTKVHRAITTCHLCCVGSLNVEAKKKILEVIPSSSQYAVSCMTFLLDLFFNQDQSAGLH